MDTTNDFTEETYNQILGRIDKRSNPLPHSFSDELPKTPEDNIVEFTPVSGTPKSTKKVSARLTVVESVYYQPPHGIGEVTPPMETRFSRPIESDESPYRRVSVTIGSEWTKLDCGWLEDLPCGHLVIQNMEGKFTQRIPTAEQILESQSRVIELKFLPESDFVPERELLSTTPVHIVIPAKESCRFQPQSLKNLYLRCRNGEAKYTLTLIPV